MQPIINIPEIIFFIIYFSLILCQSIRSPAATALLSGAFLLLATKLLSSNFKGSNTKKTI